MNGFEGFLIGFEGFLIGGIVGSLTGIAVYHYGFSTLHAKIDSIIDYVKSKT